MWYKVTRDGYIIGIGTGGAGEQISETEYNTILDVIHAKPPRTETTDYRLKTDLTWEAYTIDPDPELDDSETLDILLGGDEA